MLVMERWTEKMYSFPQMKTERGVDCILTPCLFSLFESVPVQDRSNQ